MLIQMPEGAEIPRYQTELLEWLAGFEGTETIRTILAMSKISADEAARWKEVWGKHLMPKLAKNRKELQHARNLG